MKWVLLFLLLASPALAVRPDEMLADPGLEARARALSVELRCLVCRNENIDDSDADLARDLRLLVRERITSGDTDTQAMAYIVDRYGEFVLLNPPARGANLVLWLAGPGMFLAGG
ncbi:MAG: cytochrome c-type biogenesis protein CcmH, partial [Candidatus Saccharibacteria bacterium]|nr:cytochrome c-type biogenesis protein CcmH [Pseudorhodobacter sp.]